MTKQFKIGQEIEIKNKPYIVSFVGKEYPNGKLLGVKRPNGNQLLAVFTDGNNYSTFTKIS